MSESTKTGVYGTLPEFKFLQPDERDAYLVVANDLLQGVMVLSNETHMPPRSCAMLAAHALECALKAYLWQVGRNVEIQNPKTRHDLIALWNLAHAEGLAISESPPVWCAVLSVGHGPNFYFRYQVGEGRNLVHGGQTPELVSMFAELGEIVKLVERSTSWQ